MVVQAEGLMVELDRLRKGDISIQMYPKDHPPQAMADCYVARRVRASSLRVVAGVDSRRSLRGLKGTSSRTCACGRSRG